MDKSWPSRFGTLGEAVFGKDDPFNDSTPNCRYIINDEMPPTRSPVSGKYYTSKTKLRAEYKAHGVEEIGTAYEHGWDPQKEREKELTEKYDRKMSERFRYNLNK